MNGWIYGRPVEVCPAMAKRTFANQDQLFICVESVRCISYVVPYTRTPA